MARIDQDSANFFFGATVALAVSIPLWALLIWAARALIG